MGVAKIRGQTLNPPVEPNDVPGGVLEGWKTWRMHGCMQPKIFVSAAIRFRANKMRRHTGTSNLEGNHPFDVQAKARTVVAQ